MKIVHVFEVQLLLLVSYFISVLLAADNGKIEFDSYDYLDEDDAFQNLREIRQPGQTHTGYEAIPANAVRNADFRADGSGSPIYQYAQGFQNRIEFLEGIIKERNLNRGSPCTTQTRNFIALMSRGIAADICGHIIANRLGGRGDLIYNVFPQNSLLNNRAWKSFEGRVARFLQEGNNRAANLRFWFDYGGPQETRPVAYTVVANLLEGDNILLQPPPFRVLNQANQ